MALKKGDTIGIISLSGVVNKNKLERAVKNFNNLGFKVKLSKNIYDKNRYLAGNDNDKIDELYSFFQDANIDCIICARGGYGAIRLINKIDYNIIKENSKPFCGYSDITALLLMFYKRANLIGYHSPMVSGDFGDECGINDFTLKHFYDALSGKTLEFWGDKIYKNGNAEGIIWGGNLSTVTSLCGLDFIPENDFVFFTEDLNEPVYKIDKMFQQLINIDIFRQNCKAIVLGEFLDVDNQEWFEEYFNELSKILNIPLVAGFKITHGKEKITIPIGKTCKLKDGKLVIL